MKKPVRAIYVNALLTLRAKRFELGVRHLVEPRYPLVALGTVVSLDKGKITFTNSGNSWIIGLIQRRLVEMETLATTLRSLKQMELKPNYSSLSREYGMDRHTIKKMYEGLDSPPKKRRGRKSKLDAVGDEIALLLRKNRVSVKAAYWNMRNRGIVDCTYSNFKSYVRTRASSPIQATRRPTPSMKRRQAKWSNATGSRGSS